MTKSNLKAAMDALQVKKPLRLPRRAPSFAPPASDFASEPPVENRTSVGLSTEVRFSTPASKETGGVIATQVEKPTSAENSTPVENQTSVGISTPVEKATQLRNSTQAENQTPVGIPTLDRNKTTTQEEDFALLTRRATDQDSSVAMVARAANGLDRGYTRLPNAILMQLASGDFTRNEIKLALLIARFTISFQQRLAPLSKTVLERQTGLRGAAVLEALSGLVAKGMVEKQKGDQHRPNQLGLILPEDWELTKPKRESEVTLERNPTKVEKETQVQKSTGVGFPTPARNSTGAPVGNVALAGVGNPTYFKDIKNNKNSLSPLPDPLQQYFFDLKPAKKRESEWDALESLRNDYAAEDIAECLSFLQEKGVGEGESTQRCHSPMAYLAVAMESILQEVVVRKQAQSERQEREKREADAARQLRESEVRQAAEWATKEQAFLEAFPSKEQQQAELAGLLRGSPFSSGSRPGWILGVGKWWEERHGQ